MEMERSAGILLHPTSLPGNYGIGDLGNDAYDFINFLEASGQKIWQVFPLGPTGFGDSPYQCFSAFAGNPLLISPDYLKDEGLLSNENLAEAPDFNPTEIDYGEIIQFKEKIHHKAFQNYKKNGNDFHKDCGDFCERNAYWLDDYALFMACKNYHNGKVWSEWEEDIAFRKKGAVAKWNEKLKEQIEYQKFIQYIFEKQWQRLKKHANEKGIQIVGDLPIFIAYDSADLWAHRELFSVDEKGKLKTVAGVPPDYFSATGQLWGNPLYKWDVLEKNDFDWWIKRFGRLYELIDIVRIDHFRGFDAFFEIPGDAETAERGRWVKAPGEKFFNTIKKKLGDVPIIAEDLGVITQSVRDLRDKFEFPGMKILQFAFGEDGEKHFLPHNHVPNCVVYTGSHDNDTTRGFFEKEKEIGSGIYEWAQKYLNYYGDDIRFQVIRTAYASVANFVVIPMQDILNLGSEARMNFPGRPSGNWTWRFTWDQINDDLINQYKEMTEIFERPPGEIEEEEIEVEED
jgi:4-alpha-glucanotransferase